MKRFDISLLLVDDDGKLWETWDGSKIWSLFCCWLDDDNSWMEEMRGEWGIKEMVDMMRWFDFELLLLFWSSSLLFDDDLVLLDDGWLWDKMLEMVDEMKIDWEKEGEEEGEMIDDVNEMDNGDITLINKNKKVW